PSVSSAICTAPMPSWTALRLARRSTSWRRFAIWSSSTADRCAASSRKAATAFREPLGHLAHHAGGQLRNANVVAERVTNANVDAIFALNWFLGELNTPGQQLFIGFPAVVRREADGKAS